ncbi:MAG: hypothetical protein HQ591_09640 [candidate division Zixibacteria bacterium]|nr:hypothetical protein [Candidatus Tariuqbacter arcticus]
MSKEARFHGFPISRGDILEAIAKFEEKYPETGAYDNWLKKGNYTKALYYENKCYPVKKILRITTDNKVSGFVSSDAQRVLRQLNFKVIPKYEC